VSQEKSENGGSYPQAPWEAAGPEAPSSPTTPVVAQPLSNPASSAPDPATQQAGAEVVANSSAGATPQPQINRISSEASVPE